MKRLQRFSDACTLFHLLEIISIDEVKTSKPAPMVCELAVKEADTLDQPRRRSGDELGIAPDVTLQSLTDLVDAVA